MKEYGTAVKVSDGKVIVMVKRTAACEKCGKCSHPHVVFGDNSDLAIEAVSLGDIKPGDTVELDMDNHDFLRASLLVWGLPLVAAGAGLGLGTLLGNALGNGGVWGAVFAFGSLALSFYWLHQYDKSAEKAGRYLPAARAVREL